MTHISLLYFTDKHSNHALLSIPEILLHNKHEKYRNNADIALLSFM